MYPVRPLSEAVWLTSNGNLSDRCAVGYEADHHQPRGARCTTVTSGSRMQA